MLASIGMSVELSKSLKIATIMARDSLFLFFLGFVGSLGISRVIEYSLCFSRLAHATYTIAPGLMDEKIGGFDISATLLTKSMRVVLLAIHFFFCLFYKINY